jgi:hypothetical protein
MKKINLNNSYNIDEDQIILIEQYNKLIKKEKKLNKSIEKLKKKKKNANEEMRTIIEKRKKTFNNLKKRSLILFTSVSIVYDKRWETYICIFKFPIFCHRRYFPAHWTGRRFTRSSQT